MIKEKNVTYIGMDKNLIELQENILKVGREDTSKLKEIDFSPLINPEGDVPLKATEIAKHLGSGWNSTKVNKILIEMGYQDKIGDDYYPTAKGINSGCLHRAIFLESKPLKYAFSLSILWSIDIVDKINEYVNKKEIAENGKNE